MYFHSMRLVVTSLFCWSFSGPLFEVVDYKRDSSVILCGKNEAENGTIRGAGRAWR